MQKWVHILNFYFHCKFSILYFTLTWKTRKHKIIYTTVADVKQHVSGQTITITATVDPYKYETQSSLEPWLWDSFSFEDGIIRDYFDIAVPGSITIIGRRKRVCPKFICSGAMTVAYLGNTYNLAAGENLIPDIFLGEGSHILTFGGTGTVDVDYQGGTL